MGFDLDGAIRKISDFPHKGILYYDITSILISPDAFGWCCDTMCDHYHSRKFDAVVGIEARGFVFASVFAAREKIPLLLARKAGKLPGVTMKKSYQLEYGKAEIEVHTSDIPRGGRVLIIDDLLATGGTVNALAQLLKEAGASADDVFGIIGLPFLGYPEVLESMAIKTLIDYDME